MQPGLPHAKQVNAEEEICSQLTWALVARPAPISIPCPVRHLCGPGQGITDKSVTLLWLLRYPSLVAKEKETKEQNWEQHEEISKACV